MGSGADGPRTRAEFPGGPIRPRATRMALFASVLIAGSSLSAERCLAAAALVAQAPKFHGDLESFDRSADLLPRTIAQLERGGGRVTEIRFDGRRGHPGFDAAVERGGRVVFLRLVRGAAREHVMSRLEEPAWMLGWRARQELASTLRTQVGLAEAVQEAEADTFGQPAIAAGIATLASDPLRYVPVYNVLLLRGDGGRERVAVDARTGLAIADLSTLRPWPAP